MNPAVPSPTAHSEVLIQEFSGFGGRRERHVILNRPERRNALSSSVLKLLIETVRAGDCDLLILSGRGTAFCSGLDLVECATDSSRLMELLFQLYAALISTQARTIAVVQGFAVGGGVGLAACADYVVAGKEARFRIPQGELAPLAQIVVPLVVARQKHVGQMSPWTAGEIEATAALQSGLVDRIAAVEECVAQAQACLAETSSWRTSERRLEVLAGMEAVLTRFRASPFCFPNPQSITA